MKLINMLLLGFGGFVLYKSASATSNNTPLPNVDGGGGAPSINNYYAYNVETLGVDNQSRQNAGIVSASSDIKQRIASPTSVKIIRETGRSNPLRYSVVDISRGGQSTAGENIGNTSIKSSGQGISGVAGSVTTMSTGFQKLAKSYGLV